MAFVPSEQQKAFFDWGLNGSGNCFLEAAAGCGKSTSLLEFSRLLQEKHNNDLKIIIVAFGKKIANEMKEKLAARNIRAFASTFHSFGFSAWMFHTYRKCKFNSYKISDICSELQVPEEYHSFVRNLVSLSKQHVLSDKDRSEMLEIVHHHSLVMDLEKGMTVDEGIGYAQAVLKRSNEKARVEMDYDDMIYLPVFFDIKVLQHDFVMVDEAQDTNAARRMLAAKMVKPRSGRSIWVGDRFQSIMGFTGADNDAVDIITETFNCVSLPLTVTYRCPKEVVKEARLYVDHIVAHESAPEGEVHVFETQGKMDEAQFDYKSLGPKDAILCRKTAPLVSLAYRLLRQGIACHVEGKDIGRGIRDLLTKWKKIKSKDAYLDRLEKWERQQVEKLMSQKKELAAEAIKDRCETIRVLSEGCEDVACMVAKVDTLFGDSDSDDPKEKARMNNLTLCTAHRSKGLEFPTVCILGYNEFMPSPMAKQAWEIAQERNLKYVAVTRAQEKLYLIG